MGVGILLAIQIALVAHVANHGVAARPGNPFKGKNVILFITDQERAIQHFPPGWERANLPGITRLKKNGLEFTSATTNAGMCSPARSTLLSGFLPAQHHVRYTLEHDMPNTTYPQVEMPTPDVLPNLATVAAAAGFKSVVYKGKMHIMKPANADYVWSPSDAARYGWDRWNPPDAGANTAPSEAGASPAYNDNRFMYQVGNASAGTEGALQFISSYAAQMQPFFMVISLVNPHDVLFYPKTINVTNYTDAMFQGTIGLPGTLHEDLSTKPRVQKSFVQITNAGLGYLATPQMRLKYLNFYGNLMKGSDAYLVDTLDALEASGLLNDTIVVRTSDHGEVGLAHGGMRQKNFNVYEETIRVPLVYSNPVLFPKPVRSSALVSHVDFVPTIANLFDAPANARAAWAGVDYSSILLNPSKPISVQDYVPFTYDDFQSGQSHGPYPIEPNHIAALREKRYKFAMYYDPSTPGKTGVRDYEMYDLVQDPFERTNLAASGYNRTASQQAEYERLVKKLNSMINLRLAPRPLSQRIHLNASTKNVVQNGPVFEDKGTVTGVPIGTANITLVYKLDPKTSTATNTIQITAPTGIIVGKANLTYGTKGNHILFKGSASFEYGTGAYRGIRAQGLAFTDTNTLDGQNGNVTINGVARF